MCKIRLESSSVHCPGQFTLNCFLGSAGWKLKRTVELTTCFLRMERGEMKAWEQSLSFNSFVKMMIWINPVITAALHYTINIINHISTTSSNLWRGTVQEECRHQLLDQETIYVCCFLVINWSVFIDFTHFWGWQFAITWRDASEFQCNVVECLKASSMLLMQITCSILDSTF